MRKLLTILSLTAGLSLTAAAKDVMLMNRIGPTKSELYIANPDGTGQHKLLSTSGGFDYHASYSYDGNWIIFTSERNGLGQADLYRVHPDGTGLERLTDSPSLDDQGVISPDGTQVAFVSTRETWRPNIWILDLKTKKFRNITGSAAVQGDHSKPDSFLRPSWSPDGKWIAFSSDRNTEWRGHDNNVGWEHLQELSIYIIHPDGTGFQRITGPGIASGSPKWSADSKEVVFYEMPIQTTWDARVTFLSTKATSQIVSVNIETGKRTDITQGPGLKLSPQFLPGGSVAYATKAAQVTGLAYTKGPKAQEIAYLRSPSWSPDGKHVVYEIIDNTPHNQNDLLYSWDPNYEYRYTDVFPAFSAQGKLAITNKDVDNSIAIMNADGTDKHTIYKPNAVCQDKSAGACSAAGGAAFGPTWSPDGKTVVFGYGGYLIERMTAVAKIMSVHTDGTGLTDLTKDKPNAGFPSLSPDGKEVVYRTFAEGEFGLRILNLATKQIRVLTDQNDNLPDWGVNNSIVFTRKRSDNNFDIYTISPDGSNLKRVTDYPGSDAHPMWTYDAKHITWDSSEYGFKDEAPYYDNTFQPYGQLWIMDPDGSHKRPISDSRWEDTMAAPVPPYAKKGQ